MQELCKRCKLVYLHWVYLQHAAAKGKTGCHVSYTCGTIYGGLHFYLGLSMRFSGTEPWDISQPSAYSLFPCTYVYFNMLRPSCATNVVARIIFLGMRESIKCTLLFLKVTASGLDAVRQPMRFNLLQMQIRQIGVTICNPKQIKPVLEALLLCVLLCAEEAEKR